MESKKIVEAVVLGGVLLVSANAFAQTTVCSGGTGAAISGSTTDFVKVAFTPKCSANTAVSVAQNSATLGVKAASTKGKTAFGGSTEGGGITVCSTFSTYAAPTAVANGCA